MNSAAKDIADMLNGESSLGLALGTDLFISRMPDSPIDCVTVYDNGGASPMLTLKKSSSAYYYSGISVQSRNSDYALGYTTLMNVFQFLHGTHGITINGTYYALIRAVDDPDLLNWDENDRPVFVVSFDVQRRE